MPPTFLEPLILRTNSRAVTVDVALGRCELEVVKTLVVSAVGWSAPTPRVGTVGACL
jgi:hypothetical protein